MLSDFMTDLRVARGQETSPQLQDPPTKPKVKKPKMTLEDKIKDLDNTINTFNGNDFLGYFVRKSKEADTSYIIGNVVKDRGVMKKAFTKYGKREVIQVIDFLFTSPQNYIDTRKVAPTILISSYMTTLLADSADWLEGKYQAKGKKGKVREWSSIDGNESDNIKIGEW